MQCARGLLLSVACLAVQYFYTLSYKRQDFRKKNVKLKIRFGFLSNFCLKHYCFKKNSATYDQTTSTRYCSHSLIKLELFRRVFVESANIEFHEMLS